MRVIVLFLAGLLASPIAAAQVYKYVAEDGSMVYTNEKPHPDAEPVNLPGLSVMQAPAPPAPPAPDTQAPEAADSDIYPDFRIAQPQPDEHILGTGNTLQVRLGVDEPLREGDQVMVYLDDEPRGPFFGLAFEFSNVDRGTHQLRAEVVDRDGNAVASAGPVTFHMRQHSRLHRDQPMVQPQTRPGPDQ